MSKPASSASSSLPEAVRGDPPAEGAHSPAGFSRSMRNVLWMSSSSLLNRVLNLARGILLARLLTPFDFGVYGLAYSVVGVKEKVADIGAGVFLLYRPKELEEHAETTFWVNLGLSSALLVVLAIVAPLLGRFYHEPLLTPVLVLLALGTWARVNASVHQSLLRMQSRFRTLAIIDNVSCGAWLVVAGVLAWKGFGVWALAVSAVAASVLAAGMMVAMQGWKPRWRISRGSLRQLGGFSFWYLGQGIAWYLVSNMDNFLVGRYLGMSLLGIYTLAYNYALLPVTTIGNSMGSVGFAELPKLSDRPEAFWSAYRDFSRVQALSACLVAFASAVAAPDLIPLIFGVKWAAAVVPFQILSVYAAVRCLWLDAFLATGDFRSSTLTGAGIVAAAFVLVRAGTVYGLAGVAVAMLLAQVAFNLISLRWMSHSWSQVVRVARETTPYLAGGILMAGVALVIRAKLANGNLQPGIWMAVMTLLVFIGGYGLLFRRDLTCVLRQLVHRPAAERTEA